MMTGRLQPDRAPKKNARSGAGTNAGDQCDEMIPLHRLLLSLSWLVIFPTSGYFYL
jgi:hypothetical protein